MSPRLDRARCQELVVVTAQQRANAVVCALRVLASRLRGFVMRGRRDADLHDELQAHLDLLADEHQRRGLSPAEARAAARRDFGGVDQIKEVYRDQRGLPALEALLQDVRYGTRMLRQDPGFTSVAVVSLALGIGANCAIFGLINAALLRDLPVRNPETLATVIPFGSSGPHDFSYPIFRDLSSRQQIVELAASGSARFDRVRVQGSVEDLEGVEAGYVSPNYFTMLGVEALIGRVFTADNTRQPGDDAVAVIGYGLWTGQFGSDPSIIGRTVTLNTTPVTIIGVTPQQFFGERVGIVRNLWVPTTIQPRLELRNSLESRTSTWFRTIGRLTPGVDPTRAKVELTALYQQLKADEITSRRGSLIGRDRPADLRVEVEPGSRALNTTGSRIRQPLLVLMSVAAVVLLIACCNVANLLLARGTARQQEIAIRLAIGCSRPRLVAQLITESLLLSVLGGALGLMLALWLNDALAARLALGALHLLPDWRTFAFASAVSVATALLFGVLPALHATSIDPGPTPQTSALRHPDGRPRQRLARGLIVVQVALSLWLLIGAGLLIRSVANLRSVDIGGDRQVLTLRLQPVAGTIQSAQLPALREELRARLADLPGVEAVALSSYGLLTGGANTAPVRVPESTVDPDGDGEVSKDAVSPDFFRAVGLTLLRGGVFDAGTGAALTGVGGQAVINETMARHYFGERDPIGKVIYFPRIDAEGRYVPFSQGLDPQSAVQVVGVVRDAKYRSLREAPRRMVYVPFVPTDGLRVMEIRTRLDPSLLIPQVRQVVASVNPNLVIRSLTTREQQVELTMVSERNISRLLTLFSALALVLACVGLYGVMAYGVARRTVEIGVRMALGATRRGVVSMVLREAAILVLLGVALGVPAALASTKFLGTLLFGLTPTDPSTFALMAALMLAVATLAGFLPAKRAAGIDPISALRCE